MTSYQRAFLELLHDQLSGIVGAICKGLRMILDEDMAEPRRVKFNDMCYWIAGGTEPEADKAECAHVASRMMREMCVPSDAQIPSAVKVRCALIDLCRDIRKMDAFDQDEFEREQVTTPEQRAEILDVLSAEQAEAARSFVVPNDVLDKTVANVRRLLSGRAAPTCSRIRDEAVNVLDALGLEAYDSSEQELAVARRVAALVVDDNTDPDTEMVAARWRKDADIILGPAIDVLAAEQAEAARVFGGMEVGGDE